MFKECDDFEGSIDIHGILNDVNLHDELRSLGWVEPGAPPPARPAQPTQVNAKPAAGPTLLPVEHDYIESVDIGSIGIIDEANLTLDENDLQDESLLAEFNIINGEGCNDSDIHMEQIEQSDKIGETDNQLSFDAHKSFTSPVAVAQPTSQNSGSTAVEEAKRNAVKYKREGNTTEALKWLRYAKQLENGTLNVPELPFSNAFQQAPSKTIANPSTPVARTPSTPLAVDSESKGNEKAYSRMRGDLFAPLESAIVEASEAALKEAKAVRDTDNALAVTRFQEYKALQQELAVLQSRRTTPGAAPALFHWQTMRKEVVVENMEIAEDEVKVTIEGAFGIAGLVETHSSRSISVSYMLGIAKDEAAPIVIPAATYHDGDVIFNYETVLPVLKRGRHVQQLYQRKKAVFDLILHRGFWKGTAVLCQAVLPLSDLLTKSKIGGPLELKTVTENGTSKRGKAVGGQLTVYVSIRSPLSGPEVKILEERKLVIEAWPAVVAPSLVQTSRPSTPVDAAVTKPGSSAPSSSSATPPAMSGILTTLTEQEKNDPHSVDFLESNDVLEAEICAVEALVNSSQDEDERFNAGLRLQLLQGKLQLLVYQVQNEQLSFDDYLSKIRARLQRDQFIAMYFKTLGDKDSTAVALAVMKRVLIMKKEVQNAEQGRDGEEEED